LGLPKKLEPREHESDAEERQPTSAVRRYQSERKWNDEDDFVPSPKDEETYDPPSWPWQYELYVISFLNLS
jgi:hypothetical protein